MRNFFIALFVAIGITSNAQDMDLKSGDFKVIQNEEVVNVVFNYSTLKLMKENLSEEEYVKNRMADLNKKIMVMETLGNLSGQRVKKEFGSQNLWN